MRDRLRGWSDRAIGLAAGIALSLLLLCVTLGVVTRAMGDPLIWTDEVSRFLMIWLAVLGWLLASRRRSHIRIRFFIGLLPAPARRRAELAIQLAMALFGGLILWYGPSLVARNLDVEATTVPVSMSLVYAPIVLAGLATLLQAIGEAAEILRSPRPAAGLGGAGPAE